MKPRWGVATILETGIVISRSKEEGKIYTIILYTAPANNPQAVTELSYFVDFRHRYYNVHIYLARDREDK